MNKNLIITISVGVGSAVAGFFGGWFTKKWRVKRAERKLAEKYMDLGSVTVAAPPVRSKEKVEEAAPSEDAGEAERALLATSIGLTSTEETTVSEPASPYKAYKPRRKNPFRIEEEEFGAGGYPTEKLFYDLVDGKLTDEMGDIIEDWRARVGVEVLNRLDQEGAEDALYVRNDTLGMDYAIIPINEPDDTGGER